MEIPKYIEVRTVTGARAAFLSPESPNRGGDGLKDCSIDCRLNGESTLEFYLPSKSEKISELTPECQIWSGGRVYSLLNPEVIDYTRDEKNTTWAKFMAVERWKDLENSFVEPSISNDPTAAPPADLAVIIVGNGTNLTGGLYQTGTAAHALYSVLKNSGWTLGTCDVTGIHDLEMEKESRLAIIKQIQNLWGGYIVWDSVNKIVHLRSGNTWQNYTGFQVRYKKNLKSITRTQSNKITTKMYCFGHDDLDIASVNGGKKYITNNSYTPREYIGIYKNQDIYNAQELLTKATIELSLNCHPQYKYTVKMVDVRTLPEYSHENFTVGDMVDVVDADVAPDNPRPRLLRHKYNVFKPWICDLEIGDPTERLEENLKASFDVTSLINNIFNSNGQSSGASVEDLTISNSKIKNLSADKITAGTISATISITSPYINGGTITGALFRTADSGSRLEMANTGINCYSSGNIKSGICINNDVDIGWGDLKFYYENVLEGGLQYNTSDSMSLYSRNGKSISITSSFDVQLSPNRSSGGNIQGILADNHSVGTHNHGIVGGTRLATCDSSGHVIGFVQFVESGGFVLDHHIY